MKSLILIDAGHGGLIEGMYTTFPDKRVEKGKLQINEGVINRSVAALVVARLDYFKIPVHLITPENEDIYLRTRVKRVNELSRKYNCFLLSIHHNFWKGEFVAGTELFTYYGESQSDVYAELMAHKHREMMPEREFRKYSPQKMSKEAGYYILRKTVCPAVLAEFSYMSNAREFLEMGTLHGMAMEARYYVECLIEIYKNMII